MKSSASKPEGKTENAIEKFYDLRLYVTGATPNSLRAISNIKAICEAHLSNCYKIEIIDVYKQQENAYEQQIIALPMLVKLSPLPQRKLIGDLSDTEKVLAALGINAG